MNYSWSQSRELFRVPGGSAGDIREASKDVLRLMGLLLKMPLRIVSRFEGSFYRVIDVADEKGFTVLRAGQVITPEDPLVNLLGAAEYTQHAHEPPPNLAMDQLGLKSYLGVPILLSEGQMIGTLSAADVREYYFSATIRDSLVLLARMMGHEIERNERERELRTLADISQAFVHQTDMDGTFHEVVEQAVKLFTADYCMLHRVDLSGGMVTLVAAHGVPLPIGVSRPISRDEELSATVHTARTRRLNWIPDARNSPLPDARLVKRFDIASVLYVPLVVDDVAEGVLTVAHRGQSYLFNPALLRVAEILANEAALAMRRHKLWESMKQRQHELAVLNELSTICTSRLELEPLLRELANEIRRVVADCTDCFILLVAPDGEIVPAAASGPYHVAYRQLAVLPTQPSVAHRVIETNNPVVVPDVANSAYFNAAMQNQFPLAAVIGVPLVARDKILGAILLGNSAYPHHWTRDEVNRLQTAANQVALSIDNVQLYEEVANMAVHDPLTGIYNRRYLEQKLREEMARSMRYDRPLSCVMIDVDHFKRINDTHGHAIGDRVLQEVARRLHGVARSNDVLARYGGEEFTLLLPESGPNEARRTAERIRGIIAARPFVVSENGTAPTSIMITASLGVCTRTAATLDGSQLVSGADQALYQAKSTGRNRVVCRNCTPAPEVAVAAETPAPIP